jgi:O-succinylbenzoic acid--CoA ligase
MSETTVMQDKGHNRRVKDRLARHDPNSAFLHVGERVYTFGETLDRVEARQVDGLETLRPSPDFESVVDLIAVMSSGTAVLSQRDTPDIVVFDDAASVVFTSGSSGSPKGALLSRANWEAAAEASAAHLGHGPEDTWLLAMPLSHVAGLSIIVRSAFTGGSVRMLPGFDAVSYAAALHTVTMASVVPTMLQKVLEADGGPYRGLKAVLVGGGPIPRGLLEQAAVAGLPVLPTYGMTETCGQVATLSPGSPLDYKADPLPGVEFRIGERGRIELRGPMVSPGYVGGKSRSPGDWFVTDDAGTIDADGAIRVLGRLDEMIITGGENVAPIAVENVLRSFDGIDDVVVVGLESSDWGMEVCCLYSGSISVDELNKMVRKSLPVHERPRRVLKVDLIPLTGPGKPDRVQARELLRGFSR